MRVLIVGCGYVGLSLGQELVNRGHEVFGLRRSDSQDPKLKAVGITPLQADITRPETLTSLPRNFDWVVNCASAGGGVEAYRRLYLEGTGNLIEWLRPSPPRKYVYTSSTSVYGQDDGSLVTESDPVVPPTETGCVLVETENLLRVASAAKSLPAVILRVAGIYGPGRGFWFNQFLKNEAKIEGNGERFLNMIHRDDVVGCIIAALENGKPGEIYNAVDDEPVKQLDFFAWLAGQLKKELPPSVPADPNAVRKRGATNKRVCNGLLKQELGYCFKYPTFREGYTVEIQSQTR